jgi:hypothetical protein
MASTGSLDTALGGMTLAASGKLKIKGTLTATLGGMTLAATGISHTGTLNAAFGGMTLAATGALKIAGTLAASFGGMTLAATNSARGFFFAWTDADMPFSSAMLREDEEVFAIDLSQQEGDFASLVLDVVNPQLGLLGPGRKQWCWLSWNNAGEIVPLFYGRLVGVPENLAGEVVRLQFVARPADYPERKAALAATLRLLPYWDPVWLVESVDDPDTVLETRPALWHIDRTTLELTISDLTEGEDGTIDVAESEHFYDEIKIGYAATPLRRINVKGTLSWTQAGSGQVDLTSRLVAAFQAAGSPFPWPMVSSYTAVGLLGDWPKPEANLSGGWSVAADALAFAPEYEPYTYAVRYTDKGDSTSVKGYDPPGNAGTLLHGGPFREFRGYPHEFFTKWINYDVVFTCQPLHVDFRVAYAASRKRSEIVAFTVSADAQSILVDPGAAEEESVEYTSNLVDQPIDEGGALPIVNARRNAYLPTGRGQLSLQFLMLLARRKLLARSRAVDITFQGTWEKLAAAVSCRKSVLLHDYRLPDGQAAGKIKSYRLSASGDGARLAEVTIGCSIGYGVALDEAAAGEDVYATGYATGYTARTGAEVAVVDGALHYEDLVGTYVVDDDGVDLFNMTPQTVVEALSIAGGPIDQRIAIDASLMATPVTGSVHTKGDISGTAVSNLADTTSLISGGVYNIAGGSIINDWRLQTGVPGSERTSTTFTFDGAAGGTLSRAAPTAAIGVDLLITAKRGALLTPDPVGALRGHPTVVTLDLVPVTGGDFQTEYAVTVLPLVIPQTIDLEAA